MLIMAMLSIFCLYVLIYFDWMFDAKAICEEDTDGPVFVICGMPLARRVVPENGCDI